MNLKNFFLTIVKAWTPDKHAGKFISTFKDKNSVFSGATHLHIYPEIFFATIIFCLCMLLSACGYHLQGAKQLAPELHRLYLQAPDPYGQLVKSLKQDLKMSGVYLVSCREEASA